MKRKYLNLKQKTRQLFVRVAILASTIFILILTVPNIIMYTQYNKIHTSTEPLYISSIINLTDNDSLCVNVPIEGTLPIIPRLRAKFILDGKIIPLKDVSWEQMTLSDLVDVYTTDIFCISQEIEQGEHQLTVLTYSDLWTVREANMVFTQENGVYQTLSD